MAKVDWESHFESGNLLTADDPAGEWATWSDDGSSIDYEIDPSYDLVGETNGLRIYVPTDAWTTLALTSPNIVNYNTDDTVHISLYFRLPSEWEDPVGENYYLIRVGPSNFSTFWGIAINPDMVLLGTGHAPSWRTITGTTTLQKETTYYVELVVERTDTADILLYLNGELEASRYGDTDINDGIAWTHIRLASRFDPARTGGSGIYYDAIRLGNDGMIGEYFVSSEVYQTMPRRVSPLLGIDF